MFSVLFGGFDNCFKLGRVHIQPRYKNDDHQFNLGKKTDTT